MAGADPRSRMHDLLGTVLGVLSAAILISSRWQVDASGPYPFYKGPLIFPLLALTLMLLASLPSVWRLLNPAGGSAWRLDGHGAPRRPAVLLLLMILFSFSILALGLGVPCLLFAGSGLYYLGHRGVSSLLILPCICALAMVLIFKYALGVYFPPPLIWQWIGG